MSKILITGGAGYIGSHTAVELLNSGEEIVIVDNFINSSKDVLDKAFISTSPILYTLFTFLNSI